MNTEKGKVYVLTNKIFKDNIVKIGITGRDDVDSRVKELNSQTGVPFPFEVYCVFEFKDYKKVEKFYHNLLGGVDRGTYKKKEFFKIDPENIRNSLKDLTELLSGNEILISNEKYLNNIEIKDIKEEEKKEMRRNMSFKEYGLRENDKIFFTRDDSLYCTVPDINKKKVIYNDKEYNSLSLLTKELMNKMGYSGNYNGYKYWKKDGETLWNKRLKDENNL